MLVLPKLIEQLNASKGTQEILNTLQLINFHAESSHSETATEEQISVLLSLANDEGQVAEEASRCIASLLKNYTFLDIHLKYKRFLLEGIQTKFHSIRLLTMNLLAKAAKNDSDAKVLHGSGLLGLLLLSLDNPDTEYVAKAEQVIFEISLLENGIKYLLDSESIVIFNRLLRVNEVTRVRTYSLLARICTGSSQNFELVESSGLLENLVSDVKSDDPLLFVNIIAIFEQLCKCGEGLHFMTRKGVIDSLIKVLSEDSDDTLALIGRPSVIKLFGTIGQYHDIQFIENRHHLLFHLTELLISNDLITKTTVLAVVGQIARNQDNKRLLNGSRLIEEFAILFSESAGELRTFCYQTFSGLLSADQGEITTENSIIIESIYKQIEEGLGGSVALLSQCMAAAKQTFKDVSSVAYAVLHALAAHAWGRKLLVSSSEFIEFIFNRTNATSKESNEWKFSILQKLDGTPEITEEALKTRISTYLKQGPFYMPSQSAVAFEGAF